MVDVYKGERVVGRGSDLYQLCKDIDDTLKGRLNNLQHKYLSFKTTCIHPHLNTVRLVCMCIFYICMHICTLSSMYIDFKRSTILYCMGGKNLK